MKDFLHISRLTVFFAKTVFLVFYLLFSSLVYGQEKVAEEFSINWQSPNTVYNKEGRPKLSLSFIDGKTDYEVVKVPYFEYKITGQKVINVKVHPVSFEPLSSIEELIIADLPIKNIQEIHVQHTYQSKQPISKISFFPIRKNPNSDKWEKVVNFKISYEKESSKPNLSSKKTALNNSVLSEGQWYKFGLVENGIYRITGTELNTLGIDISTIDPSTLKIYGNGGGMLPQENSAFRYEDLVENAILVSGEGDGVLNENDYLLFYGKGPDNYSYDTDNQLFKYSNNLYADSAYYFLTFGGTQGLRIQDQSNPGNAFPSISTFDYFVAYEKEEFNLISSGRKWFGDGLRSGSKSFSFDLPGIAANTSAKLEASVMSFKSYDSNSAFNISVNNSTLGQVNFIGVTSYIYGIQGIEKTVNFEFNTDILNSENQIEVGLEFIPSANLESTGYLDYLFLTVKRNLRFYGQQMIFSSIESLVNPTSTFRISNFNDQLKIWDITDPLNPVNQNFTFLSGSNEATFGASTNELKTFVLFQNEYLTPTFSKVVKNQNLHGSEIPNLVIVSYPAFLGEAERLASFRRQHDNLSVKVVSLDEVFNEFSSGAQDITAIRDYMKYLYDEDTGNKLKYLLLFGDCSYDYKNNVLNNTNKIPTYESRNSLWPTRTFSSDDYFGFLDDDEGEWVENTAGDHMLDIGIGRIPVNTISEASTVVDKLIRYATSPSALGSWRNEVYLIADDSDGDGFKHFLDAESMADQIELGHPQYNVNKLYLDAEKQKVTPNGEEAPEFKERIIQAIEKGALIVNYTGHGEEVRLAEETIIDIPMIRKLNNFNQLSLFVTATCEFGRYDNPQIPSGAEELLISPKGGAIALLTTSRPVFSDSNLELNQAFYDAVFKQQNGVYQRLGDIMIETKNNSLEGFKNRNFSLLGDPSMRLSYPQKQIEITSINGISINDAIDTLAAQQLVSITGEVVDDQSEVIPDYEGVLEAIVYDKKSTKETLESEGKIYDFEVLDNIIFKGKVSITNGQFNVAFVVPKNISYLSDNGKISMYAKNNEGLIDANGANLDVVIGGSSKNILNPDNIAPSVELYMEDTNFVSGSYTNSNTMLLAHLMDESGINISSTGLGQHITAVLDGTTVYNLNDFYQTDLDSYKSGWVAFPINNLKVGEHSITFKVWDTFNNSTEATIKFKVKEENEIVFEKLYNYPNPFNQNTTFYIEHNRAGDEITLTIDVFSMKGEIVRQMTYNYNNSPRTIDHIDWDGRGFAGKKMDSGLYIYRVSMVSATDGAKIQQYEKLVIIN